MENIENTENIESIIKYLLDPSLIPAPYLQILMTIRVLVIIFIIFLIGFIIYVFISTQWLRFRAVEDLQEFIKFKPYGSDKYAKKWKIVMKRLDTGVEAEYKLAIMEADGMLEEALEKVGYVDETIEKRLAKIGSMEISNIEELKEVRKIRNGIIYDPDYQLSRDKTKEVMDAYSMAFKNLGFL